jgi:cytoskeletal protein RodZ
MFSKKSSIFMLIVIGVALAFIAGLLLWKNYSTKTLLPNQPAANNNREAPKSSIEAGKEKTHDLIEETKKLATGTDAGKIAQVIEVNRTNGVGATSTEEAIVVAPQSNPISVKTGEVLISNGTRAANNSARAGDADAPVQSAPIDSSKLPASAINIIINPDSIIPATFTVNAGQAVVLSVTAASSVEVFKFDDPLLAAVAMGLMPRETLAINFNAPTKTGEYSFYSDFDGHRQIGAVGKMIVK